MDDWDEVVWDLCWWGQCLLQSLRGVEAGGSARDGWCGRRSAELGRGMRNGGVKQYGTEGRCSLLSGSASTYAGPKHKEYVERG